MKRSKRLLALLLALMLVFGLAACGSREPQEEESESEGIEDELDDQEEDFIPISSTMSDFLELVAEKKTQNDDTIGWLQIPGLPIDDVVVINYESNKYYERLDFNKEYNFNGIFYADRRAELGDGTFDTIGNNICIYGHALTDNPEDPKYEIKFGPLHDLRDEEIAKEVPYIFFSTENENLVYEIFAVFPVNSDNLEVPYNRGDLSNEEMYSLVTEQILPRSIYDYDVEITPEDKYLTLSTCIYYLPDGTPTYYPNTYYRFGIMAKLVDPESPLKEEAVFTINEDPLVDPDGKISSK